MGMEGRIGKRIGGGASKEFYDLWNVCFDGRCLYDIMFLPYVIPLMEVEIIAYQQILFVGCQKPFSMLHTPRSSRPSAKGLEVNTKVKIKVIQFR